MVIYKGEEIGGSQLKSPFGKDAQRIRDLQKGDTKPNTSYADLKFKEQEKLKNITRRGGSRNRSSGGASSLIYEDPSTPIQVNPPSKPIQNIPTKSSILNYGTSSSPQSKVPFSLSHGQFYTEKIGSFQAPDTRKQVPITQTYYQPSYLESESRGDKIIKPRVATDAEKKSIQTLEASTQERPSRIKEEFGMIRTLVSNDYSIINDDAKKLLEAGGLSDKNIQRVSTGTINVLLPPLSDKQANAIGEVIGSEVISIKNNPLLYGLMYGASYATGGVSKSLPYATKSALRLIGLGSIAKKGATVVKATSSGGLIGLAGYSVTASAIDILDSKTYKDLAQTSLSAGVDFGLMGYGFSSGSKLGDKIIGLSRTRGREFIDIPQGEYPTAPIEKQFDLFTKNIIKEIDLNKPVSFHTTSNKFYDDLISPAAGTSELPGLYASTYISTPFSRISGSSYGKTDLKQAIKDLFVYTEPSVAGLVPEGYRVNRAIKTEPYKIDDQAFSYSFSKVPKKGFMDLPLIKSEIEAIARIESGQYGLSDSSFYVNIKGVRVPLDVFKYDKDLTLATKKALKFEPKDYDLEPLARTSSKRGYGSVTYFKRSSLRSSNIDAMISSLISSFDSKITNYVPSRLTSSRRKSISKSYQDIPSSILSSSDISGHANSGSSSKKRKDNLFGLADIPLYKKGSSGRSKLSPAYKLLIKRRGKFKDVMGGLTRGKALSLGEDILKSELSRTARLVRTGGYVETDDFNFNTSLEFRSYNIRKGKRYYNPDLLIQKASYSLSSKSERGLIQRARKNKRNAFYGLLD